MREQEQLQRQVEQRAQAVADHRPRHARPEPRVRDDADTAAGRAEEEVARGERVVGGDPEHGLGTVLGRPPLDASREDVAVAVGVRHGDALARLRLRRGRRPERCARIAIEDRRRAASVVEDREEDLRRPVVLDVVVERPPEPLFVVLRHERVDQDERVLPDEGVRGHLRLPAVLAALLLGPLGMGRGPAPEARGELGHVHAITASGSIRPSAIVQPASASEPSERIRYGLPCQRPMFSTSVREGPRR